MNKTPREPASPTSINTRGPEVFTFPPVIFAAFAIMGYITDRAFPIAVGAPLPRQLGGGALIALGIALAGWAISRFARARTHVDVRKPATALVTGGPYRFSRNPMYVAASLLYAGIAVMFGKLFILCALVPCLIVIDIFIIRHEEVYLEALFGEPYRDFRRRVRRWL